MFHRGPEGKIFHTEAGYMTATIVLKKGKNLLQPEEGPYMVQEAGSGIHQYLRFYNEQRLHQSLNDKTPREVYLEHSSQTFQEETGTQGIHSLP